MAGHGIYTLGTVVLWVVIRHWFCCITAGWWRPTLYFADQKKKPNDGEFGRCCGLDDALMACERMADNSRLCRIGYVRALLVGCIQCSMTGPANEQVK